ncbi:MAG: hypothetical protein KJ732_06370, partial [Candidatus Margulisbacteria bacterium]|nr:hypothetical protein [Candidatus Margulisiibacteriota bacterium]
VISVPLIRTDNSIGDVFNPDLLSDGDYLYYKPLSDSPNTEKATIVSGVWKDRGIESSIHISPDYGYWIKAQGEKTLTVWGDVIRDESRPILIKNNGILVIGTVYPRQTLFLEAGLNAEETGSKAGDEVYYKPLANSANTQKVIFDGAQWSDPVTDRTFKLPYGYWYKRKSGNGDFNFGHLRPW